MVNPLATPQPAAITPRLMLPWISIFSFLGLVRRRRRYHGIAAYHRSIATLKPAATCIQCIAGVTLEHKRVVPASAEKHLDHIAIMAPKVTVPRSTMGRMMMMFHFSGDWCWGARRSRKTTSELFATTRPILARSKRTFSKAMMRVTSLVVKDSGS